MSLTRQRLLLLGCVFPLLLGGGCGEPARSPDGAFAARAPQPAKDGEPAKGGKPAAGGEEELARKVIYRAEIEVVVKDIGVVESQLAELVEQYHGYIAKSDVVGQTGSQRSAKWTLKIPSDSFRPATAALAKLGTPVRNSVDSQDVTEEFIDLQARIKNLRVEEETLNKFLKEAVTNVDGYIKTREQIKNVRGDIERAEGRLKYLSTMTALSTVEFAVREDLPYAPDSPAATTFGDRASSEFGRSLDGFVGFCQSLALFFVSLVPWTPVILVVGIVVWWLTRRMQAARRDNETRRWAAEAQREARRRIPDTVAVTDEPSDKSPDPAT